MIAQDALSDEQKEAVPGTVLVSDKKQLVVKTGDGALSFRILQPEGKKSMAVDAYLRGYPIAQGEKLGEA